LWPNNIYQVGLTFTRTQESDLSVVSSLFEDKYFIMALIIYILFRFLTEKAESLFTELDNLLDKLGLEEDNASFNFVNALEDLLWAFECRATASWVFQLAIRKGIYRHDVFRYLLRISKSIMAYFSLLILCSADTTCYICLLRA